MKLRTALVALGALAAASGSAGAENFAWGAGLKDVPAPIPAEAATLPADKMPLAGNMRWGAGLKGVGVPAPIPVPAAIPLREGFSYYLRADLGWGWGKGRTFSETGAVYGEDSTLGPFTSSAIPFSTHTDNVFGGTVGVGAYFAPRIRGDLTLDFRQDKENLFAGNYTYPYAPTPGSSVRGSVQDSLKLSTAVGLVNAYFDLLPRGFFSPYVGAGIGFVYNRIERSYLDTEFLVNGAGTATAVRVRSGTGNENNVDLAAALMGGVSVAFDHRWALDIGYRALYMGGGSASVTTPSFVSSLTPTQNSTAALSDSWEHQVRVGLRWNIW